jgi:CheY-like chemotaxis protein
MIPDQPTTEDAIRAAQVGNLFYTRDGKVLVSARRRGAFLRIAVRDTGVGIPENMLEEVFVEFRQLHNPERDRTRGLGLGLAIVKRLAALLDHPLQVRSVPGRGSCFAIVVPLSATRRDTPSPATAEAARNPSDSGADIRVLVLDDDGVVRTAMAALLGSWGYRVLVAGSIGEALDLAGREHFDLLVVDYRLPNESTGADAIRALEGQRGRAIPTLLITGDTAPARLREAGALGVPLLHKPVQAAKLRAALRHLLERRSLPGGRTG